MSEPDVQPETATTPQLNAAEKEVAKFIDGVIDRKPETMRSVMTDEFQKSYDFESMTNEKPQKRAPVSFRIIRTSKEAGSFTVQAEILYENTKSGKQAASQVVYELIKEASNNKLLINSESGAKTQKPFYKKPLFWILTIIGLVVVAAAIFFGLTYRRTTQNQAIIKNGWHDVVEGAKAVDSVASNSTKDEAGFTAYSQELNDYKNVISDAQYKANQLVPSTNDKNDISNYKTALTTVNDYIVDATSQSTNVANISSSDFTKLDDLSQTAEDATANFQSNAKFLSDKMPTEIFAINDVLQAQRDKLDEAKAKEQASVNAAADAVAQDKANLASVNTTVTSFQQGFIAGNAGALRSYMTTGFQGEYNFNQLNPDQRQFQYPSSFRIIGTTKQPDGSYKSQVNVLFKYTDNADQYTQGYEYSVISQSSKWLINNEKVGSGF